MSVTVLINANEKSTGNSILPSVASYKNLIGRYFHVRRLMEFPLL